jgi:hypothetical protein
MNEMEIMQLSRILNSFAGEPPHRVTVAAVRRKVVMRRLTAGVTATAAAAFAVSAGLLVSAHAIGTHPPVNASHRTTGPRYYFEETAPPRAKQLKDLRAVVRSTTTGALTARVRCPGPDSLVSGVAAAEHETFFIACWQGGIQQPTGTRLYRFALTRSGRVTGFRPLAGGNLTGLQGDLLTATPDGAELAIDVRAAGTADLASDILVINTTTGKHAVWQAARMPGGMRGVAVQNLSFARNGRELAVLGWGRECQCGATGGQEVVVVSHPAAGGQLASGRVLFTLRSLTSSALLATYRNLSIDDAFIQPDGATAIAGLTGAGDKGPSVVLRVSVATGKPTAFLFRAATSKLAIRPDPSGRFLLVAEHAPRGGILGWIDHGKLAPLQATRQIIYLEAW